MDGIGAKLRHFGAAITCYAPPPWLGPRLTHTQRCVKGNEKFLAKFPSSLIGLWGIWLLLPPPYSTHPHSTHNQCCFLLFFQYPKQRVCRLCRKMKEINRNYFKILINRSILAPSKYYNTLLTCYFKLPTH